MADEEIKLTEERKCFGLKEKDVLKVVIPCATSFIGCILALAVYASLTGNSPIPPKQCPPPCPKMEAPCPPPHHFEKPHLGDFRGHRPALKGEHPRPKLDKALPDKPDTEKQAPAKADKK